MLLRCTQYITKHCFAYLFDNIIYVIFAKMKVSISEMGAVESVVATTMEKNIHQYEMNRYGNGNVVEISHEGAVLSLIFWSIVQLFIMVYSIYKCYYEIDKTHAEKVAARRHNKVALLQSKAQDSSYNKVIPQETTTSVPQSKSQYNSSNSHNKGVEQQTSRHLINTCDKNNMNELVKLFPFHDDGQHQRYR